MAGWTGDQLENRREIIRFISWMRNWQAIMNNACGCHCTTALLLHAQAMHLTEIPFLFQDPFINRDQSRLWQQQSKVAVISEIPARNII